MKRLSATWATCLAVLIGGCDASLSDSEIATEFDNLVIIEGEIDDTTGGKDPLRVGLVWYRDGEFTRGGDATVDYSANAVPTFRIGQKTFPAVGSIGGIVAYRDSNADGTLDRQELGGGCTNDPIVAVDHYSALKYAGGSTPLSFVAHHYPSPCFPTFDCEPGTSIEQGRNRFGRPLYSFPRMEISPTGSDPCRASEGLHLRGKCHRLRVQLEQIKQETCSPDADTCDDTRVRAPFTSWHQATLKDLSQSGCCAIDLGAAPFLCNPALGCPEGYECCGESCERICAPEARFTQKWVAVPSGEFLMGSPLTEPCRVHKDEWQLPVILSQPFLMAATETTEAQYTAVVNEPVEIHPSAPRCPDSRCPARFLNWHQAANYCNELSRLTGLARCYDCQGTTFEVRCTVRQEYADSKFYDCDGFRLPTEAEWEYAYRAGTQSTLYNGDLAVCTGRDGNNADAIGWYAASNLPPAPGGQKQPNRWGLYDLAGNVSEWVEDWFAHRPAYLTAGTATNPLGGKPSHEKSYGEDERRILRGGSLSTWVDALRAAARRPHRPDQWWFHSGVRCVRTLQ